MLTLSLIILMVFIVFKMLGLVFRVFFALLKIFGTIVFLPIILIGMCFAGLFYIALPILLVFGVVKLIKYIWI